MNQQLLSVLREEYGRIAYSFKTHQKMIDRYNQRITRLKQINAVLLTVTAAGTIDVFVRDELYSKVATAFFVAVALCLAIYQLSMNIDRLVDQHRVAARALWLIREQYVHVISDLKSGSIDDDAARKIRDDLTLRATHIYESSPDTDAKAYAEAQQALKTGEELTFSPAEIDLLLPDALRETTPTTPAKP